MRKILTISELTRDIKEVLENVFESCCVEGEISNFRQPASGHLYFVLKDATATIRCVMFRSSAQRMKFRPEDGMLLIACGRVGVYEKEGQYQLYVEELEPKGQGALTLAFEQLKARLSKEGLFDESHKKPLPFLPETIGVVTSPTGAVIRDIFHVLDRRFPEAHLVICPVRVQGEGAGDEIAEALRTFNEQVPVDVIIVARGGGSIEDLWSFNEEVVARAIYGSAIPVISAVGHETDYTIADFVADRRAPTPSAAAEIVMPNRAELQERIDNQMEHLFRNIRDQVLQYSQRIDNLTEHLSRSIRDLVPQYSRRIDDLCGGLLRGLTQCVTNRKMRLDGLKCELEALNPLAILKRGYSLTTLAVTDHVITSRAEVKDGDKIKTRLAEGNLISEVIQTHGL